MKFNITILFLAMCSMASSQQVYLTPRPVRVVTNAGVKFIIDKNTQIVAGQPGQEKKLERIISYLTNYLVSNYDLLPGEGSASFNSTAPLSNYLKIQLDELDQSHPDAYNLQVDQQAITLTSNSEEGLFYGITTLIQLLPRQAKRTAQNKIEVVGLSITDYPRFSYRGMHLDVARHFFPVSFVKKYIDYLALNKFNYFHWHLTDDQGWRIEIKKYPLLTSVGGYRNGTIIGRYPGSGNDKLHYGGFYTQEEIKDVVRYAGDRYITIIPEIEMPGHSSAAIAAYPQLSCFPSEDTKIPPQCAWNGPVNGKQVQQTWGVFEDILAPSEYTFNFMEHVLDEVMALFPAQYIHIGGDECPKESWKRSAFCQQLIKENGLKNEHELQSYFIQRVEKYINSKGKKIIGWDEILEGGLAPNATVMSWRGESGGIAAAKAGHNVIMTPDTYCYFDHAQTKNEDSVTIGGFLPLEKVYSYEPLSKQLNEQQAKYILGAQANLWTEYISNPAKVEYMVFPRMSALSEVLWSPRESRDWKDFESRLPGLFARYAQWGSNYSSSFYGLQYTILPAPGNKGLLWKLESRNKNARIIYVKGRTTNATFNYNGPALITTDGEYGAAMTNKDHKITGNWLWQKFSFNKATGKKITLTNEPSPNYPGSGGFTLVNGIITEKKLSQSSEWLGFLGKDLEAIIDLGKVELLHKVQLDLLKQEGSWIYLPSSVEVLTSMNGKDFATVGRLVPDAQGNYADERRIAIQLNGVTTRYLKVVAKNYGVIPSGKAGGGTLAWLFADEIEVE